MKKLIAAVLCVLLLSALLAVPAFAFPPMRNPVNPDTYTTDGTEGTVGFNFKDSGGAWVNILNEWGSAIYMEFSPDEGAQSFVLTFEVSGYDGGEEGYRAMPGFAVNGWGVQMWSLDIGGEDAVSWEEVYGEKFNYYINGDGFYQMLIPVRAAIVHTYAVEEDALLSIDDIQVLELGIYGMAEDSTTKVRIVDLVESSAIVSFEEAQRAIDAVPLTEQPLPPAEPSPTPEEPSPTPEEPSPTPEEPSPTPEEPSEPSPAEPEVPSPEAPSPSPAESEGGTSIWVWAGIGAAVLIVLVVVVVFATRKKK